uniref:FAS1 domain-containing protein n=1 Tax=Romanomermis culicivorax TaxID=13658 RepID=A0A915KZ96_ROMCU
MQRNTRFRRMCDVYPVPASYLKDSRSPVTVFAEVDDSYFANNGRICNHLSNNWAVLSENSYLFKLCSSFGNEPFRGTAFDLMRIDQAGYFQGKRYSNSDLTMMRELLVRSPAVYMIIFGGSAYNGFHTFFLPNNQAFQKVIDQRIVDQEVLLSHVTSQNRVLFTESWLYDYGIHFVPSVRFATNIIEENPRMSLSVRNLTDRKTGQWNTYVVSTVLERYSVFRKGSVWGKIIVPNIPLDNGVAHIIDTVLGVVSETIEQLVMRDDKTAILHSYLYHIGQVVRTYLSTTGGMITFFAPINEAFDRIPEHVKRRLIEDRIWLERVLKLHIVPAKDLTTDQVDNNTVANTVDNLRQLYFTKGEWPKNNITYYVIGGGVKASIYQEDVAAVNGIVHFVDRVLGVPYETMLSIIMNETNLRITAHALDNMQLKYSLNPWQVFRPEQNFTFFVPTDQAWNKLPPSIRLKLFDGHHWPSLQFVLKRHILQGQALMLTDLRERQYIMMNDQLILIRRRDRYFELYWPHGNLVAQLEEGGEIAAINGFMHKVNNILVLEEDLAAGSVYHGSSNFMSVLFLFLLYKLRLQDFIILLLTVPTFRT